MTVASLPPVLHPALPLLPSPPDLTALRQGAVALLFFALVILLISVFCLAGLTQSGDEGAVFLIVVTGVVFAILGSMVILVTNASNAERARSHLQAANVLSNIAACFYGLGAITIMIVIGRELSALQEGTLCRASTSFNGTKAARLVVSCKDDGAEYPLFRFVWGDVMLALVGCFCQLCLGRLARTARLALRTAPVILNITLDKGQLAASAA